MKVSLVSKTQITFSPVCSQECLAVVALLHAHHPRVLRRRPPQTVRQEAHVSAYPVCLSVYVYVSLTL